MIALGKETFLENHLPCSVTFTTVHNRLRETGKLTESFTNSGQSSIRTREMEENVFVPSRVNCINKYQASGQK